MNYLRTDQYTHIDRECPVTVDLHEVDDVVEITLGEHRLGGDTLRLIIDHQDTCGRLLDALADACDKLVTHHSKANPNSALSQLETDRSGPLAG